MRNPLLLFSNKVPTPYVGHQGARPWDWGMSRHNVGSQLKAMGQNGTLFSIVNKTTTAVASVDWHMHRKRARASVSCNECGEKGVELVDRHPALVVLNKPNAFFTRQELFESTQQHVDLCGEGWIVLSRLGSMPYEMWMVRPDRMEPVTSPESYLLGFLYTGPTGEQVPLATEDVLFQRMPNPEDPYRGMGPVQTIMSTIDSVRFGAQWNRQFFLNDARPNGVIQIKTKMQDREYRKFRERWAEMHQGVSAAGRVAILENEAEWINTATTQRDMQFAEIAQLDKATIREAFGIPKFAVGDVDDVNRATAEASKAWFAESLTVPRLDRWKGLLNNDFLPQFPGWNPAESFVYTSPVPADRDADRQDLTAQAQTYKTLVDAGVNPEDAAQVAGLPPMRVAPKPVPVAPPVTTDQFAALLKGALA